MKKYFFGTICLSLIGAALLILWIHIQYIPVRDGIIYLEKANSTSFLLREKETGIHHIRADSLE